MRRYFILLCAGLVAGVSSALVSEWTTLDLPDDCTATYVSGNWGMQGSVTTAFNTVSGKGAGVGGGLFSGAIPSAGLCD